MDDIDRNPWAWMQPHDVERLGAVILDENEQRRWCMALTLGGLPYMWRIEAAALRDLAYTKLALKPGDKVLIIGESVASCGFDRDIREKVGITGQVDVVDILEQARDAVTADIRGRGGKRGTWRYDYTSTVADEHYDVVAVLQGVGHSDDWRDAGTELLRVMKSGRTILLAEISFNPKIEWIKGLDLHVAYWLDKIFAGARGGPKIDDLAYYGPADLKAAFDGMINDSGSLSWRGLDLFWGSKPT